MKFFYKLYLKFISNCFFIYVNSINFANEKVAFCAFKASKHCAHIAKSLSQSTPSLYAW